MSDIQMTAKRECVCPHCGGSLIVYVDYRFAVEGVEVKEAKR